MSKPNNSISRIRMPGESTDRPIIPYALGYSKTNTYQATLPVLTADSVIALQKDLNNYLSLTKSTEQTVTSAVVFNKYICVLDDEDGEDSDYRPENIYHWNDNNVHIFSTGLYLSKVGALNFPNRTGVIGLEVDIVDLTSL